MRLIGLTLKFTAESQWTQRTQGTQSRRVAEDAEDAGFTQRRLQVETPLENLVVSVCVGNGVE